MYRSHHVHAGQDASECCKAKTIGRPRATFVERRLNADANKKTLCCCEAPIDARKGYHHILMPQSGGAGAFMLHVHLMFAECCRTRLNNFDRRRSAIIDISNDAAEHSAGIVSGVDTGETDRDP